MLFWSVEEQIKSRRSEPAADGGIGTGTVDDNETQCPAGKPVIGPQTSMETNPAPRSETLQGRTARWTTSLVLETCSERSKKTNQRFLAPGCSNQQHVGHGLDCIPWFRNQVCTIPGTTVY